MPALSLFEALQQVPDGRSRRGQSYPLPAVLALLVLGMLLGRRSLAAIARLVPDYGGDLALLLGFPRQQTPCVSALSRILQRLAVATFERLLGDWVQGVLQQLSAADAGPDAPPEPLPVHLDGKTLRGSRRSEANVPGVHLLAAFAPRVQGVLAQIQVDGKTNEHKAALELLRLLPPRPGGPLITGDAIFCQKEVCEAIINRGDHYLLVVKDNQPGLATDIDAGLAYAATARPFSPPTPYLTGDHTPPGRSPPKAFVAIPPLMNIAFLAHPLPYGLFTVYRHLRTALAAHGITLRWVGNGPA